MKAIVTLLMISLILASCSSKPPLGFEEVNYSEIGEQEVLLSDFLNGSIQEYNFYDFYKAKWLMSVDEVKQQEDIEFQDQGGSTLGVKSTLYGVEGYRLYIFQEINGSERLVNMTFSPIGPVGSYATLEENLESYNKIKEGFVEVFGKPDFSSEKVIDQRPSNPFYIHSVYLVEDRWHVAHNRFELELVDNGDFGRSIILNCTPFFNTSDINYDYTNDVPTEQAQ